MISSFDRLPDPLAVREASAARHQELSERLDAGPLFNGFPGQNRQEIAYLADMIAGLILQRLDAIGAPPLAKGLFVFEAGPFELLLVEKSPGAPAPLSSGYAVAAALGERAYAPRDAMDLLRPEGPAAQRSLEAALLGLSKFDFSAIASNREREQLDLALPAPGARSAPKPL